MSTITYSSPLQEFFIFASATATPAVFNIFELTPPRGYKLIIQAWEAGTVGGGMAWGVLPLSSISGAAAGVVSLMRVSNPFQVMTGVVAVGTAGAAPGGYLSQPAFRATVKMNAVCDSVGDQRFFFCATTANEANNLSVKGFLAQSEYNTHDIIRLG
jgi:hypothetical protein